MASTATPAAGSPPRKAPAGRSWSSKHQATTIQPGRSGAATVTAPTNALKDRIAIGYRIETSLDGIQVDVRRWPRATTVCQRILQGTDHHPAHPRRSPRRARRRKWPPFRFVAPSCRPRGSPKWHGARPGLAATSAGSNNRALPSANIAVTRCQPREPVAPGAALTFIGAKPQFLAGRRARSRSPQSLGRLDRLQGHIRSPPG